MEKSKKAINESKNIRSILVSASLALAIISSYTTAMGASHYIFENIWWQAMLFSVAVQSGLFVVNLKLCEFVKKTKWVLLLWVGLIILSAWFSYVFISSKMYPEKLYVEDADRVLTEECVGCFDGLSSYMDSYEIYLLQNMEGFVSLDIVVEAKDSTEEIAKELENIKAAGTKLEFPEWSEIENATADRILTEVNYALHLLEELDTAEKNVILDTLDLAKANINQYIKETENHYEDTKKALEEERNRLKEGGFNTSSEIYAQMNADNRIRELKVEQYGALCSALNSKAELIEKYIERINEIGSYQISDALLTIQKEILNAEPDITVLTSTIEPLKEIFLKEENQDQIVNLKNFVRTVEKYEEIQQKSNDLDELLKEMNEVIKIEVSNSVSEEASGVYSMALRNKWMNIMKKLKDFIIRLPKKQQITISGKNEDAINKTFDAIQDFEDAEMTKTKALSKLERRYFAELNDMEIAWNLFSSRYNLMAILSAIFACSLDGLGALFGVFIYKNEIKANIYRSGEK